MDNPLLTPVLSSILKGENVLLSGSGGTGKTFLMKIIFSQLKIRKECALTSTTGISALNMGGMTIHSFLGIGTGELDYKVLFEKITKKGILRKRWTTLNILFVDEVSMLGRSLFEKIDKLARDIRKKDLPFGGIQLVFSADFLQLPPVKQEFCFLSPLWEKLQFSVFSFRTPYRYPDPKFYDLLLRIRTGNQTPEDLKILESRKIVPNPDDPIKPTILYSLKKDVERENLMELEKLPSEKVVFRGRDFSNEHMTLSLVEQLMDKLVNKVTYLKVGAQVILNYNLNISKGLVNGSRGVIKSIRVDPDSGYNYCDVLFRNGKVEPIKYISRGVITDHKKESFGYGRNQIPLILGYASSIHKSQGSTLDCVKIDIGSSIFEPGMAYVALSRCRTLEGTYITNIDPTRIFANPVALEFEQNGYRKPPEEEKETKLLS